MTASALESSSLEQSPKKGFSATHKAVKELAQGIDPTQITSRWSRARSGAEVLETKSALSGVRNHLVVYSYGK